jgi:hypothetical protein
MAINEFSKEEKVAFDEGVAGFEDGLVMSHNVDVYNADATTMARTGDVLWMPQENIALSYSGTDQTDNFQNITDLDVPYTIGFERSVPFEFDSIQLRDAIREQRFERAARQRLASDINTRVATVAADQGTLVVKRSAAASGYDDVAECDAIFNEQGVPMDGRIAAFSSRDYNSMASNLAARETINEMPTSAYRKSYVGEVAGFETFKLDIARRLTAAAGGGALTIDTQAAANNYYVPLATRTATTGEESNVDNRYQTITISATTNVAAGDCFTIAGVAAVHQIEKGSTGNLKTFRVISVDSGTTMTISPPIISNQGNTDAEAQYQNVEVTESATAAIVFLNTVTANVNPFWRKDAIKIIPSGYPVPDAGVSILRTTTEQGFEVVMLKWVVGETLKVRYRLDVRFGVVMNAPEMAGIELFSQT